jgi:hypothetical protein
VPDGPYVGSARCFARVKHTHCRSHDEEIPYLGQQRACSRWHICGQPSARHDRREPSTSPCRSCDAPAPAGGGPAPGDPSEGSTGRVAVVARLARQCRLQNEASLPVFSRRGACAGRLMRAPHPARHNRCETSTPPCHSRDAASLRLLRPAEDLHRAAHVCPADCKSRLRRDKHAPCRSRGATSLPS